MNTLNFSPLIYYSLIVEKKEWKDAPELIKTQSRNSKKTGQSRTTREKENRRVVEENRRNKKKTIRTGTRNLRPGTGGQRRRFNGEEYFTFSLDGLIPAYGDPSQVRAKGKK